jgi:serine/threonine-protein kinase
MAPSLASRCLGGHYGLDERLGQDGMGKVWAAPDLPLGRKVAVKVLRRDVAALDEPRRRFEHEGSGRSAGGAPGPRGGQRLNAQVCIVARTPRR